MPGGPRSHVVGGRMPTCRRNEPATGRSNWLEAWPQNVAQKRSSPASQCSACSRRAAVQLHSHDNGLISKGLRQVGRCLLAPGPWLCYPGGMHRGLQTTPGRGGRRSTCISTRRQALCQEPHSGLLSGLSDWSWGTWPPLQGGLERKELGEHHCCGPASMASHRAP